MKLKNLIKNIIINNNKDNNNNNKHCYFIGFDISLNKLGYSIIKLENNYFNLIDSNGYLIPTNECQNDIYKKTIIFNKLINHIINKNNLLNNFNHICIEQIVPQYRGRNSGLITSAQFNSLCTYSLIENFGYNNVKPTLPHSVRRGLIKRNKENKDIDIKELVLSYANNCFPNFLDLAKKDILYFTLNDNITNEEIILNKKKMYDNIFVKKFKKYDTTFDQADSIILSLHSIRLYYYNLIFNNNEIINYYNINIKDKDTDKDKDNNNNKTIITKKEKKIKNNNNINSLFNEKFTKEIINIVDKEIFLKQLNNEDL